MINANNRTAIFKMKSRVVESKEIQIVNPRESRGARKNFSIQKNKIPFAVQFPTRTRIWKGGESIYVNAPSREIKKWFVTRRI
jgi:hypothetical protein